MSKPDYCTLREETKFRWFVGSTYSALLDIMDMPIKEFNLNPSAGIELYQKGRSLLRDMFGPDVSLPVLSTPPISYGHINGLGAELLFPDDGEVNHSKICDTLEKGIEILKKDIDFSVSGMAQFYIDYRKKMLDAFNGEACGFSYSHEGPITTAFTLCGDNIFLYPYDEPELFKEFLHLEVDSIVKFVHFRAGILGNPPVNPENGGMCDDISSMLSPSMWPEFVLPYFAQYYKGITTGSFHAHIEDLSPDHVPFLEHIGLINYDPSISPKINPKILNERCRVPFGWRLGSFHYYDLSCKDVKDFVFQAVHDGASYVFTYASATMCNEQTVKKVHSFIEAAKQAENMLERGATREQIGECVSDEGKKKFWDHWPE